MNIALFKILISIKKNVVLLNIFLLVDMAKLILN